MSFHYCDGFIDDIDNIIAEGCVKDDFEEADEDGVKKDKLRFMMNPTSFWIQRKNQNGSYVIFTIDSKSFFSQFFAMFDSIKEQLNTTFELYQALETKSLTKADVQEILAEKNPIIIISNTEKIAFQSGMFWSKMGAPKAFATLRKFHKTKSSKIYLSNSG